MFLLFCFPPNSNFVFARPVYKNVNHFIDILFNVCKITASFERQKIAVLTPIDLTPCSFRKSCNLSPRLSKILHWFCKKKKNFIQFNIIQFSLHSSFAPIHFLWEDIFVQFSMYRIFRNNGILFIRPYQRIVKMLLSCCKINSLCNVSYLRTYHIMIHCHIYQISFS